MLKNNNESVKKNHGFFMMIRRDYTKKQKDEGKQKKGTQQKE